MKFKSWDNTKEIELSNCPFCGSEPIIKHIGNDYTKTRSIEIKCPKCRIKRIDTALRQGFSWLEEVATKNWNQRSMHNKPLEPTRKAERLS